jgi:hypothetical protein
VAVPLHIARVNAEAEQARRGQKIADLKAKCERLLREGQEAQAKGTADELRWALYCFKRVHDQVDYPFAGEDPELVLVRQEADRYLAEVERKIKEKP